MAKQTINVGTASDDGTGDTLRAAFVKVNTNFTELYNEIGGEDGVLSSLKLTSNKIITDETNANIILDPNGTGKVEVDGDSLFRGSTTATGQIRGATLQVDGNANIDGNLTVDGTLNAGSFSVGTLSGTNQTLTGNLIVQGNTDLGDTTADTVTVTGRFDSSLVPSVTQTNDLGGSSLRWRDLYARDIDARNGIFSGTLSVTGQADLGQLRITGNKIESDVTNADITLDANGTGTINVSANKITNVTDPTAAQDAATKAYVDATVSATNEVVEDTTPQLGGNLDLNSKDITGTGNINITGTITATNLSGTFTGSTDFDTITTDGLTIVDNNIQGSRSNDNINLIPNGTGNVALGNLVFDADQTIGSGQDNYILTYDDASGTIRLEVNAGAAVANLSSASAATVAVATDSIAFIDADDSDATKKESIVDLVSAIAHTGLTASAGRITANFTELSQDTSPQLGGDLDLNSNDITGTGDINITGTITATTMNVGGGTIDVDALTTDGLRIVDNNIQGTRSNENITLIPNGTGQIEARGEILATNNIKLDSNSDLITNGNRITHASSGTVSFLDFTKTLFSETNHTVLSSVKSIDFFLDSNGGDSGQAFRIYNNANPDGSVTENTFIFKVAEDGDVSLTGKITMPDGSVSDNYAGFGADEDLKIFHNGNHSVVRETGTGNLHLQSDNEVILSKDADTEPMVRAIGDGAVELYHDNVKKFETTANGITVTGNIANDGITITDNNITSSRSNDNIVLDPNGTGAVQVVGNLTVSGSISGTISGSVTGTVDADSATVSNLEVDNFKASAIVIEGEGIASNDNDTTLPTSAAVKDFVDTETGNVASDSMTFTNKTFDVEGTGNSVSNIDVANFKAAAIVTEGEGIGSNDNDTTLPTSAAVKDYVDNNAVSASSETTFTADVKFNTGVEEKFATLTGSTGVVAHDCNNGHVFYHTGASGDITANFTNLGLTAEYATNLTVIINQGGTPYEVTAVQIGGVAQTLNWQGGSAPTGNANGIDSFSFTILNDGGSYVVLGQMVDFT